MDVKHIELRTKINLMIDQCIAHFYEKVPGANHQLLDNNINLEYYKRNLIEIILRLRMKRSIDALTIHYFTKKNPRLAKKWATYTADEMLHDSMFVADLERVGVSSKTIYSCEPFFATKLLQGYFYYGIEHEGVPLASLCSSYFIEYASEKTQPAMIKNMERVLGAEYLKGQKAHVNHDHDDNHINFVWDVLTETANLPEDEDKILQHISNVYSLFEMYYKELYMATFC